MVCVRPGLELTCASFEPISELSTLDLPTLERPRKAISGATGGGNLPASATEVTNCAWTFMVFLAVNFIASGAKAPWLLRLSHRPEGRCFHRKRQPRDLMLRAGRK